MRCSDFASCLRVGSEDVVMGHLQSPAEDVWTFAVELERLWVQNDMGSLGIIQRARKCQLGCNGFSVLWYARL